MKIRTSLTLKYTGITAVVMLISMIVVYCVSEHTRSRTFFYELEKEGMTKAHLYLSGKIDAATMHSIYFNNRNFIEEVEVAVYTEDFKMLYHDAVKSDIIKESASMINRICKDGEIYFYIGKYQGVGIVYPFGGKKYVVTAAAYDVYGYDNLKELRSTLIILSVIGLSILFAVGYLLSWLSLRPVRAISRKAEMMTVSDMTKRIPIRNKDEIGELSMAFNELLDRLEASFKSQKMFVSNVSHELKTPLAALMTELDLSLQKQRSEESYRHTISNALADAVRMNRLIEGLLNLAKADYQKGQIALKRIRLDELLLDVRNNILRAHPDYSIELNFEQEFDNDDVLTVNGNEYLLGIAFSNLIDNNCKYSQNHKSFVSISYWESCIVVRLSDNGSGISETDKENLFKLFHRGKNDIGIEGSGIGMVLTQKIINLHNGGISVYSREGEGTTYIVELPHI